MLRSQRLKVTQCVFTSHSCYTCQLLLEKIAVSLCSEGEDSTLGRFLSLNIQLYPIKVHEEETSCLLQAESAPLPRVWGPFCRPRAAYSDSHRGVGRVSAQLAELATTITAPPPAVAATAGVWRPCGIYLWRSGAPQSCDPPVERFMTPPSDPLATEGRRSVEL